MSERVDSSQSDRPERSPGWMTAGRVRSPFLPHVVSHCRTCARLCAELAEGDIGSDEASEAIGDCAITCGALVHLLMSGSAMDRRRALRTCAADCRWAAEACRPYRHLDLARQCERACLACAALCDHECEHAGLA